VRAWRWRRLLACAAVLTLSAPSGGVEATTGYFQIGHGPASTAMGGASISFFRGPLSAVVNPASLLHVKPGVEVALMGFLPRRGATLDTSGLFGEEVSVKSESPFFIAPNLAASWSLTERLAVGVGLYSSGGMNTEYRANLYHQAFSKPISLFSAAAAGVAGVTANGEVHVFVRESLLSAPHTRTLGVNLEQAVITPSLAYKVSDELSVGVSALVGVQRFSAQGLGDFVSFSKEPLALTDNGAELSMGLGGRLGLSYSPLSWLRLGAVASSKVYMSDFERYQGLFADEGDFDIPAHLGLGLALRPLQMLHISADVTRILYEGVTSISNPGPTGDQLLTGFNQNLMNGFQAAIEGVNVPVNQGAQHPLGAGNGYGFGWESIWVMKVGASLQISPTLELMLGYAYGQDPIASSEALFNMIAPAVVQHHYTGGASYSLSAHHQLTVSYQYVLNGEVLIPELLNPEVYPTITQPTSVDPILALGLPTLLIPLVQEQLPLILAQRVLFPVDLIRGYRLDQLTAEPLNGLGYLLSGTIVERSSY